MQKERKVFSKGKACSLTRRADIKLRWHLIRWKKGKAGPFVSLGNIVYSLSRLTGSSEKSIYYSLTGSGKGRLTNPGHSVQKSWAYCAHPETKQRGFIIRKSAEFRTGVFKEFKPTYSTPEKKAARTRGFQPFFDSNLYAPRVLTLGAEEGYCIQEMMQMYPEAEFVSIEREPTVRKKFDQKFKNRPNVSSVGTDLAAFVEGDSLDFDFLNLDAMGYMSKTKADMFDAINRKTRAWFITLTIESQRGIRNKGAYPTLIRRLCPKTKDKPKPDQIRFAIERSLTKYRIVDDYTYSGHSQEMRMFVLVRRGLAR